MSRRTVSRAVLEGGIAAQIQIGHELAQAEVLQCLKMALQTSMCLMIHITSILKSIYTNDGMSLHMRIICLESHLHLIRLLRASRRYSGKLWGCLGNKNKSPLQNGSNQYMRVVKAMSLLRGVNTDHCTKAKKYADVMEGKMIDATRQLLGEEQILDKSWEEIETVFDDAWERMVEELEEKQYGITCQRMSRHLSMQP